MEPVIYEQDIVESAERMYGQTQTEVEAAAVKQPGEKQTSKESPTAEEWDIIDSATRMYARLRD